MCEFKIRSERGSYKMKCDTVEADADTTAGATVAEKKTIPGDEKLPLKMA